MHNNEEEQNSARRVATDITKNQLKKRAWRAGKKMAKHAAKVAFKAIFAALKAVFAFLLKLLGPFMLIAIAIIIAVMLVFAGFTMLFSKGDESVLGELGVEIKAYAEERALNSVDQSKPEQIPYAVPVDLIYSVLQLYIAEERSEREIKKAIDVIVNKLKPEFEYDIVEDKIYTYEESCVDGSCSSSESTEIIEVEYLKHVEAWNGTLDVEMIGEWGEWDISVSSWTERDSWTNEDGTRETETTHYKDTTKIRHFTHTPHETWVEDYTAYDRILRAKPFEYEQTELILIESLFKLTGGEINYSLKHLGMGDATGQGLGGFYFGANTNVIPGAGVPAEYMQYYMAGQKAYGVDWFLIAAIHYVETKFSTHEPMISYAGAEGHTQFMPCTWVGWNHPTCKGTLGKGNISEADKENPAKIKKYGGYGVDADGDGKASMWSLPDAIMTTAKYLSKSTKGKYNWNNTDSVYKAIRSYNHSDIYVQNVYSKAVEIKDAATFTANTSLEASSFGFIAPTTGNMTSSFGERIIGGKKDIHRAMDIGGNYNRKVFAVASGTVTKVHKTCGWGKLGSKCGGGWGNHVRISHMINGVQFETIYAHLSSVGVGVGEVVQGQIIGRVGSSGSSTGPHLHFELHSPYRQGSDGEINALNPILYVPPIPANEL